MSALISSFIFIVLLMIALEGLVDAFVRIFRFFQGLVQRPLIASHLRRPDNAPDTAS